MAHKNYTIDGASHYVDETVVDIRVRISTQDGSEKYDFGSSLQAECDVVVCGEHVRSWKVHFTFTKLLRIPKSLVTKTSGRLAEVCYVCMSKSNLTDDRFVTLVKEVLRQRFSGHHDEEVCKLTDSVELV